MNKKHANTVQETHPLFPSGDWEGFYTYSMGPSANRYPMSFNLEFQNGKAIGVGADEVGTFSWDGKYDSGLLVCRMTKGYHGQHDVYYDGRVDENGIWGKWKISGYLSGGFHIWPKNNSEKAVSEEIIEEVRALKLGF